MAKRKGAPKSVQIGADVEPALRDRVLAYARGLHVSEGALITLLIARELQLKRLSRLPLSDSGKKSVPRSRLTGRQSTPSVRSDFENHVKNVGLKRAAAIATLAEVELREKWLWKCLNSE